MKTITNLPLPAKFHPFDRTQRRAAIVALQVENRLARRKEEQLEITRGQMELIIDSVAHGRTRLADIVILPELSTTGIPGGPDPGRLFWGLAEGLDGETCSLVRQTAWKNNILIGFGLIRRAGDKLYNSYILTGPTAGRKQTREDFTVLCDKALVEPFSFSFGAEHQESAAGSGYASFVLDQINFGLLIGRDIINAQCRQMMQQTDPELVIVPGQTTHYGLFETLVNKTGRSFLNVNYAGLGLGRSAVYEKLADGTIKTTELDQHPGILIVTL